MFPSAALLEQARHTATSDVASVSDDRLLATKADLILARAALDAADARVDGELHARDATNRECGMRTAGWLAREGKVPSVLARKRLRLANALRRDLPGVADALAEGVISVEHAFVLVDAVANPRVGDQVVVLADQLVADSVGVVFERWRDEVRALVELLDQDGGFDPGKDPAVNHLAYAKTMDGVTHMKVTLNGDDAEAVIHALNTTADDLYRRITADHAACPEIEIPSRGRLLAMAMVELARRGGAVDLTSTSPPRPEVTFVMHQDDPDTVYDANGHRVGDRAGFSRCCDPDFYAVMLNSLGQPVDLGRKTRTATPHQRRAIAVRDGGCVFPGCDRPIEWLDNHHVDWWTNGGHTRVDRLCGLCRFHHGVAHRPGWHLNMDHKARVWFETPKGHTFWGQQHGHQHQGPAPPTRMTGHDANARAA